MASFNSAFASARKAGKKTFKWQGKNYNTKLASGGSKAKKTPSDVKLPKTAPRPTAKPTSGRTVASAPASAGTAFAGVPKLSIADRAKTAVSVFAKGGVRKRNVRNAAAAKNAGAGASVQKMLDGMNPRASGPK